MALKTVQAILAFIVAANAFAQSTSVPILYVTDKGCKFYMWGMPESGRTQKKNPYTWDGQCDSNKFLTGKGKLRRTGSDGSSYLEEATYVRGYEQGDAYELQTFHNGKIETKGRMINGSWVYATQTIVNTEKGKTTTYKGEFREGKLNGQGETTVVSDGGGNATYKGGYENGLESGYGVLTYQNKARTGSYRGGFKEGKRSGMGEERYSNDAGQTEYKGSYLNDKASGYGILYFTSPSVKSISEGQFLNGELNGQGKYSEFSNDYAFSIEGTFVNGIANGQGKVQNIKDGTIWVGNISNDKMNGKGVLTNQRGDSWNVEFNHGVQVGTGQAIPTLSAEQIMAITSMGSTPAPAKIAPFNCINFGNITQCQ